jgi:hypothetical protein
MLSKQDYRLSSFSTFSMTGAPCTQNQVIAPGELTVSGPKPNPGCFIVTFFLWLKQKCRLEIVLPRGIMQD